MKDNYDHEFTVINRQLNSIDLRFVIITDFIATATLKKLQMIIIPVVIFAVATLIHILPSPTILVYVAPVVLLFATLFCWCYYLHKYLRITQLQLEKLRLEAILDRNCLTYEGKTYQDKPYSPQKV